MKIHGSICKGFVALFILAAALAGAGRPIHAAPDSLPAFMVGADVSELAEEEQLGGVFKDHGAPGDVLAMLKERGCNIIRLRLFVNPTEQGGMVNDLPYNIALGKRVKDHGFLLLLDLHYSDRFADPGKQFTPAAWQSLPFDALVQKVHDYTRGVVAAMRAGGAMPDIVQVGNEITNGMLWPIGHVEDPGGWARFNALLRAGIAGVREGSGDHPSPAIMIHINNGADDGLAEWFFDHLEAPAAGGPLDFDLMGFSYYPDHSKSLSDLSSSLMDAENHYHKPIVVVETAYPSAWEVPTPKQTVYSHYGISTDGQSRFLHDLIATVRALPGGCGRGVLYWEPESVPFHGIAKNNGGKALFDQDFNAKPALDALTPN